MDELRKHFFNEDYFEVIDSEQKAYWLGFISADGTITKASQWDSYRLRINLQIMDKGHLILLRDHIGAKSSNIIDYLSDSSASGFGTSQQSRIVLNSKKMCSDLKRYNVVVNKSDIIEMPDLKKDLVRHYIRGFIDGDGSFHYCPRKGTDKFRFSFEVVGNSLKILEQFQKFFAEHGIKLGIYQRKGGKSHRLMSGSGRAISMLSDLIYKDATVYLERKYLKTQEIKKLAV